MGDASYLAYPWPGESSTSAGDVVVMDAINLHKAGGAIKAHKTALSSICLSTDGSKLATASEKVSGAVFISRSQGTVIRVFEIPLGKMIYTLRRGSFHSQIYSLSFNGTLPSLFPSVGFSTQRQHALCVFR